MATIYNVEITSHWISYSKEDLEMILKNTLTLRLVHGKSTQKN